MKRIQLIGILLVTSAVLIGAIYQLWPAPELRYEGKTLNDWITKAIENYPQRNPTAIQALRQMGEPAVLRLAGIVESEDSKLKLKIVAMSERIPAIHGLFASRVNFWNRIFAANALGDIGPTAKSAIPALEKMAQENEFMLQMPAKAALIQIRNESLDPYIKLYREHSGTNSAKVHGLLATLGPAAKQAVPMLLDELQSTESRFSLMAVSLLGRVGVESPECVSPLAQQLSSTNRVFQSLAMGALANFGPLAKPAFPQIAAFVESNDARLRSSALHCLWRAASKNDLIPYRAAIDIATNDVDETAKAFAEKILNEKFNQP